MKRFLAGVASMLMIPMLAVVATAESASAAACNSNKRYMVETWYKSNVEFVYVETGVQPYKTAKVTLKAQVFYDYCPNGSGEEKMRFDGFNWCINPGSGEHHALESVTFNSRLWSDNSNKYNDPAARKVETNSANWFMGEWCESYAIPSEHQKWYRVDERPRWRTDATLNIDNYPDKDVDFTHEGSTTKFIHYGNGEVILDWH